MTPTTPKSTVVPNRSGIRCLDEIGGMSVCLL